MRPLLPALLVSALLVPTATAEPQTYRVDIGEHLDEFYILSGWYGPEGPYEQYGPIWSAPARWARQGATMRIPVVPGADNQVTLRADFGEHAEQRLRCFVEGRLVAELAPEQDLIYEFTLPADVVDDRRWLVLRWETERPGKRAEGDTRDLRMVLDWVEVRGDGVARDPLDELFMEVLARAGYEPEDIPVGRLPDRWRRYYDPNDVGSTHAPSRYYALEHDDSAWAVASGRMPQARRGEVYWYRAWLRMSENDAASLRAADLPGRGATEPSSRAAWVNGRPVEAEDELAPAISEALRPGINLVAIKVMEGPLPRIAGDAIIEPPTFDWRWTEGGLRLDPRPMVAGDRAAPMPRTVELTLRAPSGAAVHRAVVEPSAEGRSWSVDPGVSWDLTEMGEYFLEVETDVGRQQRIPLHFLGIHFFHWGWYAGYGGTQWNGWSPTSNEFIDQLFDRMDDWGQPHHSISWGGAILTPGTGFHRTEGADYVQQFRSAITRGELGFVGMPYPPRNICTDFGESLLRSIRRSRRVYEEQLGATPHRFYSHDATMTPLLPQILTMTGYDTYCIAENWWGQGQSIPNSRDSFFRNRDGSQVRVLDSWYHGISPVSAAHRVVALGKPAILCNEEFACLDRTVFLEPEHVERLAAERIFVKPISLDKYQRVTARFARETIHQGDEGLCYKGWTGGGEGEMVFEQAGRSLETRLVALENLVALVRYFGIEVEQAPIDDHWEVSFRAHECHLHWGNGYPNIEGDLRTRSADAARRIGNVAAELASRVAAEWGEVLVANPQGYQSMGLARADLPPGTQSLVSDALSLPVQPLDGDGECLIVATGLPSLGYATLTPSAEPPACPPVAVDRRSGGVTLDNGRVAVSVTEEGALLPQGHPGIAVDVPLAQPMFALPSAPGAGPISTAERTLNLDHYAAPRSAGEIEVLIGGPAVARVRVPLELVGYPHVQVAVVYTLAAGEPGVRARMELSFPRPTTLAVEGAPEPHEGTYIPALFLRLPIDEGVSPITDMSYCLTDDAIESTNHATFMSLPFRNGTFNGLSLVGPSTGEYHVTTQGLHDFFVARHDEVRWLGVSLGSSSRSFPWEGEYAFEYGVCLSGGGDQAWRWSRAQMMPPVAALVPPEADGDLPPTASLLEADGGPAVVIAGAELEGSQLRARVVSFGNSPGRVSLKGLAAGLPASSSPPAFVGDGVLHLPPRCVRELVLELPGRGSE